jgi:hypothetical protein
MRKHGKFREKGTNFLSGNLEEPNRCSRRETQTRCGVQRKTEGKRERVWAHGPRPGKMNWERSDINQKD